MIKSLQALLFRFKGHSLKPRDRRAVILGAYVLLPALLISFGLRPAYHFFVNGREQLTTEQGLLQRERALLAEAPQYPNRFEHMKEALLAEAPRLFGGPDAVTATGGMASYVTFVASENRVFIQGSETRPASSAGEGVLKIQIEIRAIGDLEGIEGMLREIERGSKLVQVERFTLTPAQRVNPAESSNEEILGFTATLSGYTLSSMESSEGPS